MATLVERDFVFINILMCCCGHISASDKTICVNCGRIYASDQASAYVIDTNNCYRLLCDTYIQIFLLATLATVISEISLFSPRYVYTFDFPRSYFSID